MLIKFKYVDLSVKNKITTYRLKMIVCSISESVNANRLTIQDIIEFALFTNFPE